VLDDAALDDAAELDDAVEVAEGLFSSPQATNVAPKNTAPTASPTVDVRTVEVRTMVMSSPCRWQLFVSVAEILRR
jgi:hypothetical protein